MTLEEKVNKWNLRFFESLWAIQVNLPAADINDLGLAQFLEEHKASAVSCCQGVNAPLRPGGSCDALDSEGC